MTWRKKEQKQGTNKPRWRRKAADASMLRITPTLATQWHLRQMEVDRGTRVVENPPDPEFHLEWGLGCPRGWRNCGALTDRLVIVLTYSIHLLHAGHVCTAGHAISLRPVLSRSIGHFRNLINTIYSLGIFIVPTCVEERNSLAWPVLRFFIPCWIINKNCMSGWIPIRRLKDLPEKKMLFSQMLLVLKLHYKDNSIFH